MKVDILEVNVSPITKFTWDSDKKKNRWNTVGNYPFRYAVTCKLKIDGKIIETYKTTKHFEIDTSFSPAASCFAEALNREINLNMGGAKS
jgi:hypothetical protein